jgi:hypothetical protein
VEHVTDTKQVADTKQVSGKVAKHLSIAELEAGLDDIMKSPADVGTVELIVCRPAIDMREILNEAWLEAGAGLIGDTWGVRWSSRTADGTPHPDMALTLMNARSAMLVASDPARRMLAGDQIYLDLDLGVANLPPGTRLAIGSAVIEMTDQPHLGCAKFSARFGEDALRFVNSRTGRELRLRGANTRIIRSGVVRTGDVARKVR